MHDDMELATQSLWELLLLIKVRVQPENLGKVYLHKGKETIPPSFYKTNTSLESLIAIRTYA